MLLVGDIGGTNTRLALIEPLKGHLNFLAERTFSSREEPSLESALRKFLTHPFPPLRGAAFGVAGPVRQGRCEATNLPWVIDSRELARELTLPRVGLINDWEAGAYGLDALEEQDFEVLNPGAPEARGNRAVIAAGTGLGEVGIFWDDREYRPFASEGGHADFAPRNHLEMGLLDYLLKRHPRVSAERVVCGQGLFTIYQFLRDQGHGEEPQWLVDLLRQKDPPAVITEQALTGKSSLCTQALDLFVSLYGAEAGNMALKVMATGGVYLGGGIAPKIIAKLKEPVFLNAFTAKGRMRPLLQTMPVRVIMNPKVALLGAARYALRPQDRS
ncbi:MAG: glucokinase [Deltaproteobacteria bacterium]|nr:glucokinase [Deltaproteobacteria bacterium]